MSELILVPTPLQDDLPLEIVALEKLQRDSLLDETILLVEEHKVARRRWLNWGLPREAIDKFILFNEHSQEKLINEIIGELKKGKKVYLLSDCGLPAFCDPGQKLVDQCYKKKIKISSTPFPNSIALAVALSGFSHDSFVFCGFIPVKNPDRSMWIDKQLKRPEALIWMETPYRLGKLISELSERALSREVFLGMDLGAPEERLLRGKILDLRALIGPEEKREFVLMISPL